MSKNELVAKVEEEDVSDLPMELQECLPVERRFLEAFLQSNNAAEAARVAGAGNPDGSSSANTMARIAHRFLQRPRVQAAFAVLIRQQVRKLGPSALLAAQQILNNPAHKDLARVSLAVIEKIDPSVQKVDVSVAVKFDPVKTTLEYLAHLKSIGAPREVLVAEFGEFGLDHFEKLAEAKQEPIIDAEFTELLSSEEEEQW